MPLPRLSFISALVPGATQSRVEQLLMPGLDAYDREEAKRHARQQAVQALDQSGEY